MRRSQVADLSFEQPPLADCRASGRLEILDEVVRLVDIAEVEWHQPAAIVGSGQRADEKIAESGASVCSATDPATADVIAFGDEDRAHPGERTDLDVPPDGRVSIGSRTL